MIEGKDPIVTSNGQIGQRELVAGRPRQALDVMTEFVAEQSRDPTLKRRQTR